MAIGTIEREMFAEKELKACPHVGAEPMLRLVEAVRPFDIGKVPAGSTENEWRQSFGAKRIDQCGSLNGKCPDGGRIDVGLAIVDGAFNGQKFEWVEAKLPAAEPVCVSVFGIKVSRTTADGEQPQVHVIKEPFRRSRFAPSLVQHSR